MENDFVLFYSYSAIKYYNKVQFIFKSNYTRELHIYECCTNIHTLLHSHIVTMNQVEKSTLYASYDYKNLKLRVRTKYKNLLKRRVLIGKIKVTCNNFPGHCVCPFTMF